MSKKEQKETSSEDTVDKVLKNEDVKNRVDKIVNEATKNIEQDILARQDFLTYVENNPAETALKNYKQVARDEYNAIASDIANASQNISTYDRNTIQGIRDKIDSAVSIEGKLLEKLNQTRQADITQSDVQKHSSSAPKNLSDILSAPEKYERYRIGRSNVYNTEGDDKTYDGTMIGNWIDPRSAMYMTDVVLRDFAEIEKRNMGFEKASIIT